MNNDTLKVLFAFILVILAVNFFFSKDSEQISASQLTEEEEQMMADAINSPINRIGFEFPPYVTTAREAARLAHQSL